MKAKANTTYAIINNNTVTQLFTRADMPEWNEEFINAVALTNKQKSWVKIGTPYDEALNTFTEPSIDEIKEQQIAYINANFEKECEMIKGEHIPADEQMTWRIQEQEAEYYNANPTPEVAPLLNTLAQMRGIPLEMLIEKVLEKNARFRTSIALLVGNRQALQDRIDKAETIEEVLEIEYISPFYSIISPSD